MNRDQLVQQEVTFRCAFLLPLLSGDQLHTFFGQLHAAGRGGRSSSDSSASSARASCLLFYFLFYSFSFSLFLIFLIDCFPFFYYFQSAYLSFMPKLRHHYVARFFLTNTILLTVFSFFGLNRPGLIIHTFGRSAILFFGLSLAFFKKGFIPPTPKRASLLAAVR